MNTRPDAPVRRQGNASPGELVSAGDEARSNGDACSATRLYRAALAMDPRAAGAWPGLAEALWALGRVGEAKNAALRGIETEPRSWGSWRVLLETLLAAGECGHAVKASAVFSRMFPAGPLSAYLAARVHISLGRLAEGRKSLMVSLEKKTSFTPAYLELFGLASAERDFRGLVLLAGRALRECPSSECDQIMSSAKEFLFRGEPSSSRLAAAAELPLVLAAPVRERALRLPPHFLTNVSNFLAAGRRFSAAKRGLAALLDAVAPGAPSSEDTFMAKCRLDRYPEAFHEAEELLSSGGVGFISLWNPWFTNRIMPKAYWKERLAALSAAAVPGKYSVWKRFYLSILRGMAVDKSSSQDFGGLPARYAWMNYHHALDLLSRCDMRGALAVLSRAAASIPGDPYLLCKYAEVLICAGRVREGFKIFDSTIRAGKWAHDSAAWKGQMLLMRGDYCGAERLLSARRTAFSEGWLGAVLYLTGRRAEALSLLKSVERKKDRKDRESALWLAEVYRNSGRNARAKRLLDRLIKEEPFYDLARVNRALLNAASGEESRVRSDLVGIDPELLRAAASACGMRAVPGKLSAGRLKKILEKVLELAGGNRRCERYFLKIGFPGVSGPSRERDVSVFPAPGR